MLCIVYVIVLSAGLGFAGFLAEQAMPHRWPRRWIWCAVIVLSILAPPISRARHTVPLVSMQAGDLASAHVESTRASSAVHSQPRAARGVLLGVSQVDGYVWPLWAFASALLLVWGCASALYTWRTLRAAERQAAGVTLVDQIPVLVTPALGPASVGLLRPRVVIPRWVLALPALQRRYVLRHENEHRGSYDGLVLFVASLAVVVTPWNLPLYWHLRRLRLAVEMDCDARVIRALGNPPAYATLLLRVAMGTHHSARLQPAFLGGSNSLERRLEQLLAPARRSRATRYALALLAVATVLALLAIPHPVAR